MTSSTPSIARAARNASSESPSKGSIAGSTSVGTPIGTLWLSRDEHGLNRVDFDGPDAARSADPLLAEAEAQLLAYFAGERRRFELPLSPRGTDFQRRVWAAVEAIPYGETMTYSALAAVVGSPSAWRAVGAANGRNPLPVLVPCHRLVGAAGALTGYGGGLERKRALLDLESAAG
jgi:methylated-DNA-[protein]-cysteine S-methyltransferase